MARGRCPRRSGASATSDVFPTNNSLIAKSVLKGSGLFDLAYDRGSRADGDLGMRIYLSGALMVLNPAVAASAPPCAERRAAGAQGAGDTYASSRSRLSQRHLPAVTEIYLSKRYFNARQVREMAWLVRGGNL